MEAAPVPRIEPASPGDLPEVLLLLAENRLPVAGVEDCAGAMLVARAGGRIVGAAALEIFGSDGLLRSVVVEAGRRGTGLGARLVAAATDLAASRSIGSFYLLTETAEGFFRRRGFSAVDRSRAPEAIRRSVEFASACRASAVLMRSLIGEGRRGT